MIEPHAMALMTTASSDRHFEQILDLQRRFAWPLPPFGEWWYLT